MNDEEIRTKIRERLRKGVLRRPRTPLPSGPGQVPEAPVISPGPVMGHLCSGCCGDKPDFTIRYPDSKEEWFHTLCHHIYMEEIQGPILN